ncbi:meiotic recombination protein REC8 homolog isoform X2 [Dunckerocampus dactyliophorus]|uniref:meiotic recombination protein REC8 homolog isoform X2 n=1 Tax=Dunckerocampus dactyliophorus TaxID=161453 RepID=UPI002405E9CE|nr:meiotic recombination protein REC8 homolog isoform X2 [Dunckerocampus dactyliophorus]
MFYYPVVLRRHTGCFSTIWLVATGGIRVPRREFLKVNVKRTCDDIMDYLLEQVPPPHPSLPRPRFSLYLSSQLQYGIILVFHRQCAILLEELQSFLSQLLKQRKSRQLDMDDQGRQVLLLPDALSHLEDAEGAPDPLFGVMDDRPASVTALMEMAEAHLQRASPHELTPRPLAAPKGITASPETITLRETELGTAPAAQFEGPDLAGDVATTLELLMAQPDDFLGDMDRRGVAPAEAEVERERAPPRGREMDREPTQPTFELQPMTASSQDATLLSQDEPRGIPPPIEDELTPVVSTPVLSPMATTAARSAKTEAAPLSGVRVPKRRSSRQLIFFDPETQISQETMQRQIRDPLMETKAPTLLPPLSQRRKSAGELLGAPCNVLPEELLSLWKQAATITPVAATELRPREGGAESSDSERDRERELLAEKELPRPEVPTGAAELDMIDISGPGSLEVSAQQEVSREVSPVYPADQDVSKSISTLPDIPEVEELGRASKSVGLLSRLEERQERATLFHTLLPLEADRRTVSNVFQKLLGLLSSRKLCVEQDTPYGDILITPGPNFEEESLLL